MMTTDNSLENRLSTGTGTSPSQPNNSAIHSNRNYKIPRDLNSNSRMVFWWNNEKKQSKFNYIPHRSIDKTHFGHIYVYKVTYISFSDK